MIRSCLSHGQSRRSRRRRAALSHAANGCPLAIVTCRILANRGSLGSNSLLLLAASCICIRVLTKNVSTVVGAPWRCGVLTTQGGIAGIGLGRLLGEEHASTPQSGVETPRLLKRSLPRLYYCCCCVIETPNHGKLFQGVPTHRHLVWFSHSSRDGSRLGLIEFLHGDLLRRHPESSTQNTSELRMNLVRLLKMAPDLSQNG